MHLVCYGGGGLLGGLAFQVVCIERCPHLLLQLHLLRAQHKAVQLVVVQVREGLLFCKDKKLISRKVEPC